MERKDFTGKRFGKVVVVNPSEKRERGSVVWNCRCDCGKEFQADARRLKTGLVQSCGCEPSPAENYKDLTGMRFGRLMVLGKSGNRAKDRNPLWLCQCDCGGQIETTKRRLLSGGVSSCGCGRTPPLKDWVGKRFGRVTVLAYAGKKNGVHLWRCRCDCGKELDISYNELVYSNIQSCGCRKKAHDEQLREYLTHVNGTSVEMIKSKKLPKDNTTGHRGVYLIKGKYVAKIVFQKKAYYLGSYDRPEDAAKARKKAEEILFDGTVAYYEKWKQKADADPEWAKANPVTIHVFRTSEGNLSVSYTPPLI